MDDNLLERFFKGECSAEERSRVVAWYLSGEADKALSERIEAYWWAALRRQQEKQSLDHWGREALFDEISNSIHESGREKKVISMHSRTSFGKEWKRWRYAAAVALLTILSGWWYFNIPEEHASQPSVQISYISKQTDRGEKRSVTLDDGTVVKLNADSRLRYSTAFGQDSIRKVYLEGEAFFDVARDTLHPFQIYTGNVITTVLGTSFNIEAFAPDEEIAVSVVSGEVKVAQQDAFNEQIVYLLPGEQAVYTKKDTGIAKKEFDHRHVLSWKDGTLYFKNAEFSDIVNALERWYGVTIEVRRQGIEDGFSGSYTHRSLESVLEGIGFVLEFDYEINGRKIIIK